MKNKIIFDSMVKKIKSSNGIFLDLDLAFTNFFLCLGSFDKVVPGLKKRLITTRLYLNLYFK